MFSTSIENKQDTILAQRRLQFVESHVNQQKRNSMAQDDILFTPNQSKDTGKPMIDDVSFTEYKNQKWLNFCKATYVAVGFFILFIAFFSVQNLTSQVMKNNGLGNLGYTLLAILYLFIGIGSMLSSAIQKKLGIKTCLVLGGLGHFFFVFAQTLPAWRAEYINDSSTLSGFQSFMQSKELTIVVLVISVILNGLGAAILWVAQGEYFSKCATENSKGFYFGYFWSIYQGSQIFGSLFGSILFKFELNKTIFQLIMSVIALVAVLSFMFIRTPYVPYGITHKSFGLSREEDYYTQGGDMSFKNSSQMQMGSVRDSKSRQRVSLDPPSSNSLESNQASIALEFGGSDQNAEDQKFDLNLQEELKKRSLFYDDIKLTLSLLVSKKMRLMLPQIVWTGASISYWSGLLTPIMTLAQNDKNPERAERTVLEYCLFAFMFFGIGQAISGILMGKIIDVTSSKKACIVNIFFMGLTLAVSIINIQMLEYGWISYVTCFVWGMQDGVVNTHCFQMLGFEFDSQNDPFSVFALVQGISVFIFQTIQGNSINNEDTDELLKYTYVNGCFGLVCLITCFFFDFKQIKPRVYRKTREIKLQSQSSQQNLLKMENQMLEQQKLLIMNSFQDNKSNEKISNISSDQTGDWVEVKHNGEQIDIKLASAARKMSETSSIASKNQQNSILEKRIKFGLKNERGSSQSSRNSSVMRERKLSNVEEVLDFNFNADN